MKKLFFMVTIFFFGAMANAQAWTGKGDQKIQLGLSAWGYGTGVTGTYDYGLNQLISVGAGINGYFDNYKNNDKDNRVFVFGRLNFHLKDTKSNRFGVLIIHKKDVSENFTNVMPTLWVRLRFFKKLNWYNYMILFLQN